MSFKEKVKEFLLTFLADIIFLLPQIAGAAILIVLVWVMYAGYQEMDTYCDKHPVRCEEIKEAHPMIFGNGGDLKKEED